MLIFRQLLDPTSSTYSYLLGDSDSREAILIDPVIEQVERDVALIHELELKLIATLETHVHADHVTGAWLLRKRLGSQICLGDQSGAQGADRLLAPGDTIHFGKRSLSLRPTPGHTDGCVSYIMDDESMAFTGDALLIRGCGRTDFQQGSAGKLYQSVHTQLFTLPKTCLLYPAHDYRGLTVSSVAEEQQFNPRLGGEVNERDFTGYMNNLNLPHPRQIDIAVPANLKCGKPDDLSAFEGGQNWAHLNFTFAGIWEISPQALEECQQAIQLIDVREESEFTGPLGHIRNALLMPIDQLENRKEELNVDQPVVAVCRSGARSAQATVLLQKAGFRQVANLAGGMLRWRAEGHEVAGGLA